MGVHPLISHDTFPAQSEAVGQFIDVQFPGDGKPIRGQVVRDDVNFPKLNRRIIKLEDGRLLLVHATTDSEVVKVAAERGGYMDETEDPRFANGAYPKQGPWHMRRTRVCFKYDTSKIVMGTIVRDDAEAPGEAIIALDDGRWILTTECWHRPQKGNGASDQPREERRRT